MTRSAEPIVHSEQRYLLLVTGVLGFLGCGALVGGTLVAQAFVPDYNWVSDTISDLAAGRHEILMDVALYGFAVGIMATALAAAHCHPGGSRWSVGILSLALLAVLVTIIAARNEYGDGDRDGVVIHQYLVYGLALLFTVVPFSMASGVGRFGPARRRWLLGLGILWVLTSPVFMFMGTAYDGVYERGLGLIACGQICLLDSIFLGRARAAG